MKRRMAFTLIELLVVVMIIAILISIMLPSMANWRDAGRTAGCMGNVRNLGIGFATFAKEHGGRLPGVNSQRIDTGPGDWCEPSGQTVDNEPTTKDPNKAWATDWIAGMDRNFNSVTQFNKDNRTGLYAQPTRGTIYPYVNKESAFRCPSLTFIKFASGKGSNGQFDFTMMQIFSGATIDVIPQTAVAYWPGTSPGNTPAGKDPLSIKTILLVEEDPTNCLNNYDGGGGPWTDGAWCNNDRTTFNHQGGTNIMAQDGTGFFWRPPTGFYLRAGNIYLRSRKGADVANTYVGNGDGHSFGYMNGQ